MDYETSSLIKSTNNSGKKDKNVITKIPVAIANLTKAPLVNVEKVVDQLDDKLLSRAWLQLALVFWWMVSYAADYVLDGSTLFLDIRNAYRRVENSSTTDLFLDLFPTDPENCYGLD